MNYAAMLASLTLCSAGLLLSRSRPRPGVVLAAGAAAATLLFGGLELHARLASRRPILGEWSDTVIASRLASVIIRDVPRGGTVLMLHWRSDQDAPRLLNLERALADAGLRVIRYAPPPEVPTGRSNEVMRITMEEGGVPPAILSEAYRLHTDCRAMIVLLNFTGIVPDALLASLPPLYLDARAARYFNVEPLLRAGRVGAALVARPATSWTTEAALQAGPEGAFDMRYELRTATVRGASP